MTRKITPVADLVSLWRLWRVMRRERFTIVHTHTPKAGLLGQLAARLAGVPLVINTVHGFYLYSGMHPVQGVFTFYWKGLPRPVPIAFSRRTRRTSRQP